MCVAVNPTLKESENPDLHFPCPEVEITKRKNRGKEKIPKGQV